MQNVKMCGCHTRLTIKQAVGGLTDELFEFLEEPSKDELSDVLYCVNRLAGSLLKKTYFKVVGGDQLHIEKATSRFKEYGCIRSKRHLVGGRCPSLGESS